MNWCIVAIGTAILIVFYAGWHGHTIYDGYVLERAETKVISDLGKGQTDIVNFNQDLDKVKIDAQDCTFKPHPDAIGKLLY